MKVNIYCLYDPTDCKIRYIGRTRKALEIRLIEHISKSKYYNKYFPNRNPPHKVNWINSLLKKGVEPKIKKLTEIKGWNESYIFETTLIGKYKNKFNLLNAQDRGIGPESRITTEDTKKLISKTLKEKHERNEIKKKTTKLFLFDKFGNLLKDEESITSTAILFNTTIKAIISRIKSKRSIDNIFISKTCELKLEDYLYLYNYENKELRIFNTFSEIMQFLNISDFIYKKLDKNKKPTNGWIINSLEPNLNKKEIILYKYGIEYKFNSVKEASNHIGCLVYAVYDLLNERIKSIKNYKKYNI
jgi:hypothetical protein